MKYVTCYHFLIRLFHLYKLIHIVVIWSKIFIIRLWALYEKKHM